MWKRVTQTLLLIACVTSLALTGETEAQDYEAIPEGSTVLLPSGDSLLVQTSSRLVSDAALVRTDSTLRSLRSRLETAEQNSDDAWELHEIAVEDARLWQLRFREERAWRSAVEPILESQQGGLLETLENFGLVAGGFAVCRMTEPR